MFDQNHTSEPTCGFGDIRTLQTTGSADDQSTQLGPTCLHTLYLTDPEHDREELLNVKGEIAQKTCSWILSTAEYIQWRRQGPGSRNILWICGGPGSGKTLLSIYFSKHLEHPTDSQDDSQSRLSRKELVLYFFCNGSGTTKSTETGILQGLLLQALRQRPDMRCHAQKIYEQQRRHSFQDWSFDMLWMALRAIILENYPQDLRRQTGESTTADQNLAAYAILDGLDECELASIRRLLLSISTLGNDGELAGRLKVMVLSREKPTLRDALAGSCLQLNLEAPSNAKAVSADVQRYIVQKVDAIASPDRKDFSTELCASVKEYLSQNSLRNFLWVSMAIGELESTSRIEAWEHLSRLPSTLDAIYEWIVMQIPHGWRELSTKVLLWVALAFRPLSLTELLVALDERRLGLTDHETLRDCINRCGQILRIAADGTVQLVHYSAREYLLGRLESSPSFFKNCVELNPVNLEEGHRLLAGICIRNLGSAAHPGIQNFYKRKSGSATNPFVKYDTSMPTILSDYAREFWTDHVRRSNDLMLEIVDNNTELFDQHSTIRGVLAHETSKGLLTQDVPVLHHAAYHGFAPLVERLLRKGWMNKFRARRLVRQRDSLGRTALHLAVCRDENGPIVRLLLDRGADVYCKDNAGATALDNATEHGTTEVVSFLQAYGKKSRSGWELGVITLVSRG